MSIQLWTKAQYTWMNYFGGSCFDSRLEGQVVGRRRGFIAPYELWQIKQVGDLGVSTLHFQQRNQLMLVVMAVQAGWKSQQQRWTVMEQRLQKRIYVPSSISLGRARSKGTKQESQCWARISSGVGFCLPIITQYLINYQFLRAYFIQPPLIFIRMQTMSEEQELLVQHPAPNVYDCSHCLMLAQHPVLPPCGHLHCWKCLHSFEECRSCGVPFEEDLFSLFVDHGELETEGLPLPPKPRPKYSQRVRNSGGISNQLGVGLRNQDNIAQGVQLAGYGLFPSLAVNGWGTQMERDEEEEGLVKLPWRCAWWLLVLLLIGIVCLA